MLNYLSDFNAVKKSCFIGFIIFSMFPIFVVYGEDDNSIQEKTQNGYSFARGFFNVTLGSSFEEVKYLLAKETLIVLLEDPDIFVIPEQNYKVLRAEGTKDKNSGYRYIQEAFFQFNKDDVLVALQMSLNTNSIDYFTLFDIHEKKYGKAEAINPHKALWQDDISSILIEKPLVIRYMLNSFFASEQENSIDRDSRESHREEFLSLF